MASDPTSTLPRLPRGPHGLSRETVEQSQRNRILLAVTEAVAEKGWAKTSVADIVRRASVSRSTFYELFDDRLDCFLTANEAAYEILIAVMRERLNQAAEQHELSFAERISVLTRSYLETLTANHGLTRVFLVEVYAAGPQAIDQRRRALDRFVDLVLEAQTATDTDAGEGGAAELGPTLEDQRMMTEVVVAAVSSFVTNAVGAGDIDSLEDLHKPIMDIVERLIALQG